MPMVPLKLSSRQRRRLRDQLRVAPSARVYRRGLAILHASRGQSVEEIARSLGVVRQSVYNWIDRYSRAGHLDALEDLPRSGRPARCSEDLQVVLEYLLESSPQDWGYFDVGWTVPLLQRQLFRATRYWLSEDTVRRELHRCGYVWKRPRYELEPDPELEKKTPDPRENQAFAPTDSTAGRR
jgi:transposase